MFLSDSKRSCDVGLGHKTLAGNIAKFRDHDSMPMQIDLSQLDEGDGLENTLVRCKARCHKSCHDLFNSTKSKRAVKKHVLKSEQPVGGKYSTQSCSASPASLNNSCTRFFCGEYSTRKNHLHNVSTFGLDAHVRKCAMALQD